MAFLHNARSQECWKDHPYQPVANNCAKYSQCDSNGKITEYSCPTGLYYNCFNRKCQKTIFPPCCNDDPNINNIPEITDSSCDINDVSIKNPYSCGEYYVCQNNLITGLVCKEGEEFDETIGRCIESYRCARKPLLRIQSDMRVNKIAAATSSSSNTTNTTNSTIPVMDCDLNGLYYVNRNNCRSYYQCEYGTPVSKKCLFGLAYWNCFANICSPFKIKACCDANSTVKNLICFNNGRAYPNPFNVTQYYLCEKFMIKPQTCDPGTVYVHRFYQCMTLDSAANYTGFH